jgi:DNA-binding CsgD family transcriptional regulator
MPKSGGATRSNTRFSDAGLHKQLHALVRGLDDLVNCDDGASERVLVDIDLDGRRYLLIRGPAVEPRNPVLSPREAEIVRLVAGGHPNKVIAALLEISAWTVGTHVRRVFAKLGVTSRAAMVARLAELGGLVEGAAAPTSPLNRFGDRPKELAAHHPTTAHARALSREDASRLVDAAPSALARCSDRVKKPSMEGGVYRSVLAGKRVLASY